MSNNKKLSVIIPCYNEKNTILRIVEKINRAEPINKEIVIVDDCSNDGTLDKLKDLKKSENIKILFHEKNYGKGRAIRTALEKCSGDIILIQDADLEYDPEDYKNLIKPILEDFSKVVYGSRVLGRKGKNLNFSLATKLRIFANYMLTKFSNIINNQSLTDAHTCYKVFDSSVFFNLNISENDFAFCPEVTTKLGKKKYPLLKFLYLT